LQPCVALGVALQQKGCQVSLVTHGNFENFVGRHGLGFWAIPGDVTELLKAVMSAGISLPRFALAWSNYFRALLPGIFPVVENACKSADAVLFTPFSTIAYHAAEAVGARCIRLALQPMYPTRSTPNVIVPALPLGGGYNLLSHQLAELTAHWSLFGEFNRWRGALGLPTMDLFRPPYFKQDGRWITILHAYSPTLIPPPADWDSHVHVTGFWELEQARDWQPPQSLVDFLEAGAPPVYIGFGSMMDTEFSKLAHISSGALAQIGQRGILLGGWGGLAAEKLGEHIYQIDEAPHDWLFPHMSAVVHHGGVGTLAAGLRAGLPTVVVPFLADQPFWGRQTQAMGLGPAPIQRKRLTANTLAQAIQFALQPEVRRRARALGEKLRSETGVQRAADLILCELAGKRR